MEENVNKFEAMELKHKDLIVIKRVYHFKTKQAQ